MLLSDTDMVFFTLGWYMIVSLEFFLTVSCLQIGVQLGFCHAGLAIV